MTDTNKLSGDYYFTNGYHGDQPKDRKPFLTYKKQVVRNGCRIVVEASFNGLVSEIPLFIEELKKLYQEGLLIKNEK